MQLTPSWLLEKPVVRKEPSWVKNTRLKAYKKLKEQSFPNVKQERFKYTDLSGLKAFEPSKVSNVLSDYNANQLSAWRIPNAENILLVNVNGKFLSNLSDTHLLPKEVIVCSLQEAFLYHQELVKQHWFLSGHPDHYYFANLNFAAFEDGLFIYLPEGCYLKQPLHIIHLITEQCKVMNPHHLFVLGTKTQAHIFEEFVDEISEPYVTNTVSQLRLNPGANLKHYKLQRANKVCYLIDQTFVEQKQGSCYQQSTFSVGGLFARAELRAELLDSQTYCKANGFYHLKHEQQYIDHHVDFEHVAPQTKSEMLYKGIIASSARAVFNGRLHVHAEAQQTEAYQANHHLLLSPLAEAYSKPELEIYADNVKCKHGATTGQINADALFYLRSRGIDENKANRMLMEGFADEVLSQVHHNAMRSYIKEKICI